MNYGDYLTATMMKGGAKIVPIVVSIVVGYFLFIKLPFWFFRRTLKDARQPDFNPDLPKFPEEPKVMKLEEKIKRDAEELKKEKHGADRRKFQQQQKKEEPRKEQQQQKKEPPKRPAAEASPSPESIFDLRHGEKFTPEQLKAKHRELIKQSHPDKVASMGPDFKKLAEKKTKEINEAYDKLKKKAS
jgi:DnaJ like chaperone protein